MEAKELLARVPDLGERLVEWRRALHRIPEPAFEEKETSRTVEGVLRSAGLVPQRIARGTGLLCELGPPGPAILLRADMDALPIEEETGAPYASTRKSFMHACGHDGHMAMLIGAGLLLRAAGEGLRGRVRLLWQPAEEVPPGGGRVVVEEGRLEGVSETYALHLNPAIPSFALGTRAGELMAAMDSFSLTVHGRGSHAAMPEKAHDPVIAAAAVIEALQTVVSRRVSALDPIVVSVCELRAGSAFNVIPEEVWMRGTVRTLSASVREKVPSMMEDIAKGAASAHSCAVSLEYVHGTPVLVNDGSCVAHLRRAYGRTAEALGRKPCHRDIQPSMGGEDFAFYLQRVKGALAFLGSSDGTERTSFPLHNSRFDIDESVLATGALALATVAVERAGSAQ